MFAGQRRIQVEQSARRFSPGFGWRLCQRLVALAVVLSAMAIVARVSSADFISDSAAARVPCLIVEDGSLLSVLFERIGCGAVTDQQESPPQSDSPRQHDRQSRVQYGFAGGNESGCGSTPGPTTSGGGLNGAGILDESSVPLETTSSARVIEYDQMSLPAPIATRLLDPPRCFA